MRRTRLLAAVALAAFGSALTSCDNDDILAIDNDEDYEATLNAASEVPTPTGSPTATAIASIELEDRVLTVTVTVTGQLTSNVTMAHIHGPAAVGATGNIVFDFVPSMTTVINAGTRTGTIVSATYDLDALTVSSTGVLRIDANALVEMMNSGQTYVNVHTVTNGSGEIRGQIARD